MKLETSQDLLERIRAKYDLSWYGLIALMEVHKNTVYSWKANHTTVDKRYAIRIAELLDEKPPYVLACLEAERDPDHAKIWQEIAVKFRSHAASILLAGVVLVGFGAPTPSEAYDGTAADAAPSNVYYGKSRRKLSRWLKKKNAAPLTRPWTWARIRSMGSVPRSWSPSPVPI